MAKKNEPVPAAIDPEDTTKMQYVLKHKHVRALREEAHRRAKEDGSFRPDASALLREILDSWLTKGKR